MIDRSGVHPMALVHTDCEVGEGTKVWQFASVIRGARVGSRCSIASCAIVDGAVVGDRTIISHGAFIDPGIEIGWDVFVGPNVSLCNDCWPRANKEGFDMDRFLRGNLVTTRICDGASLGAGVVVLPGLRVGVGAMVAAGAVVTSSVPDRHLYKRDGRTVLIVGEADRMARRIRGAP